MRCYKRLGMGDWRDVVDRRAGVLDRGLTPSGGLFLLVLGLLVGDLRAEPHDLRLPPISLREATESFQVLDGFEMQLLAAEPLVTDPVAIAYDEWGRAYVVEMNDYPYTDKSTDQPFVERTTDQPIGRVRRLEDTDGDGRFDRSEIFAEGLSWPTGVACWRGGVFVVATPDMWYLKDTTGDGVADVRRKVLTGFRKFNVQAVVNNLKWGLDHRIYAAGGTNGGQLRHPEADEDAEVRLAANDLRFDPRDERFELLSGGARFGNTFDDWGERFICNIRNPVRHVVLPAEYLSRNRFLSIRSALHDAAEFGEAIPVFRASPPEPWRILNAERLSIDPTTASPRSEMIAAGYMTSACGITIYRGAAYPDEYYGNVFLAEPSANLVHRQTMQADGVTFRAVRADAEAEIVASTDNWFRPVNFVNAPDGTLHVLDMYRETIEHPWSIPDDIKAGLDLESGRDRGRIYRLAPPGFRVPEGACLADASTVELVEQLSSPNSWHRETAHRLLFERQDRDAVPRLRKLLRARSAEPEGSGPRDTAALGRLHALWSLVGLDVLDRDDLLAALRDPAAGVRRHAVRLAEAHLSDDSELRDRVTALADDGEMRVRFAVALALGEANEADALAARARVARRDGKDAWMRAAILTAPPETALPLLQQLLADGDSRGDLDAALVRETARIVGSANRPAEIVQLVRQFDSWQQHETGSGLQREVLLGLADGVARQRLSLSAVLREDSSALAALESQLQTARQLAIQSAAAIEDRVEAVAMLRHASSDVIREVAEHLLQALQPQRVQQAAVRLAAHADATEAPRMLIDAYRGLAPAARSEAVETLLARRDWAPALLDALENGTIPIGDVPRNRRRLLVLHPDDELKRRAETLFRRDAVGARAAVIERYQESLTLPADAQRGGVVYRRVCQACHQVAGEGHPLGPSLDTIRHRTKGELLLSILDPNREVAADFVEYVAALKDGRIVTGVIASETPTTITLRRAEGIEATVLRDEVEELASTGKSLMPEGLEAELTKQDLADLLAFLLGAR